MTLSNTAENALGLLLFNNTAWANIGDAGGLLGSSTAGSWYIALCSSDPGETGTGSSMNEVSYGSYARVAVARSGAGFTVSGDTVTNAAAVTFPTCSSGSVTATHFGIVSASSNGILLASGALNSSLAISTNIQPNFAIGVLSAVWA